MIISVIVTNYNYGDYLGRCIRSLIDQSLSKDLYEIIVVDDCSTDHSRQVLQSFSGFVRTVFNEKNYGLGKSCNIGLKMAIGKYVVRVDADDYVHKDFLYVSRLFLQMNAVNHCAGVAVDYLEVDEQENILERKDCSLEPIACGIMFHMDALVKIGLYNENLRLHEEVELRSRMRAKGMKIDRISLPLYRYKVHPKSLTAHLRNERKVKHDESKPVETALN